MGLKYAVVSSIVLLVLPSVLENFSFGCPHNYLCYSDLVKEKACKESGNPNLDKSIKIFDNALDIINAVLSPIVERMEIVSINLYERFSNIFIEQEQTFWEKLTSYVTNLIPTKRKSYNSRMYDILVPSQPPDGESIHDLKQWMPSCTGMLLVKIAVLSLNPALPIVSLFLHGIWVGTKPVLNSLKNGFLRIFFRRRPQKKQY